MSFPGVWLSSTHPSPYFIYGEDFFLASVNIPLKQMHLCLLDVYWTRGQCKTAFKIQVTFTQTKKTFRNPSAAFTEPPKVIGHDLQPTVQVLLANRGVS